MVCRVPIVVETSPCGRFVRYNKMLGKGAFKKVYLGFDQVEKVKVAWNQIRCVAEAEEALTNPEKLFFEAILMKSLDHERIMKCFSYWLDSKSKRVNMITELFILGSLKKFLSKCNGAEVDFDTIKNWSKQILEGLIYLHGQNPKIIHRDIKCDNVFVHAGGKQVKLGDLGLAIRLSNGDFAGEFTGTPEFIAPECYDTKYNELVDVYAFGMCLLEMVTGEYPYSECRDQFQVYGEVVMGVKPAALGKVKDSRVKDIIEKCLLPASVRPSAEELLKDPFFLYNDGSNLEACAPFASSLISHFQGLKLSCKGY